MDPDVGGDACSQFRETDVSVEWFGGTVGAGGQHRNKHECAARLTHRPTGIVRTAQTRSRKASLAAAMRALQEAVVSQQQDRLAETRNADRRSQVGLAERADKRRTYRHQENRVIDHATGRQARLDDVMMGRFEKLWR